MLNIAAEVQQDGCVSEWSCEQQELLSLTSNSYITAVTRRTGVWRASGGVGMLADAVGDAADGGRVGI